MTRGGRPRLPPNHVTFQRSEERSWGRKRFFQEELSPPTPHFAEMLPSRERRTGDRAGRLGRGLAESGPGSWGMPLPASGPCSSSIRLPTTPVARRGCRDARGAVAPGWRIVCAGFHKLPARIGRPSPAPRAPPETKGPEPFYGLPGPRQGDRHPLQKRSGANHLQRRGALPAPRKVSQVARAAGGGLKRLYGPRRNLWLYRDLRDHRFRRLVKHFTNSPPPLGPWRHMTLPGRRPWPLPAPCRVLFAPPGAALRLRRPVLNGEAGDALDAGSCLCSVPLPRTLPRPVAATREENSGWAH